MPTTRWFAVLWVATAGALAGCALGRDEVKLAIAPAPANSQMASKGKSVFVRTVVDERVFSSTGDDPTTPSLDKDGDNSEIKARAIARKRNGYQMSLGDVLLEPGQTVAGHVGETLRQAFRQAGYTVVTQADGKPEPIIVDVRIKKFWTWKIKGFTAITLRADIDTDLVITGAKSGPGHIAAHIEEETAVALPSATTETLEKALASYRAEAVTKLADMRF